MEQRGLTVETISIHALREEGDRGHRRGRRASDISIHALREEGDVLLLGRRLLLGRISIHALREEGDARVRAGSQND